MKKKLLKKLSASLIILSLSLGQLTVLIPALGYNEAQASENTILGVSETRNNLNFSVKALGTNQKKNNLSTAKKKLGTNLLKLVDSAQLLPEENRNQVVSQMKSSKQYIGEKDAVGARSKKQHVAHGDLVNVYVSVDPTASTNAIDSYVWEVTDRSEADHLAVALVETSKLETLASLSAVKSIRSVTRPRVRKGSVTAEGDVAMKTAQVRSTYSQQGAGIKIGVISDGVDHMAEAKSSGDLPTVTVLDGGGDGGDEGTAMLEIIYDMAPGASLYFHQSGDDLLQFNSAYDDLAAAGCKIIVDDLGWDNEPWFEDGVVNTHLTALMESKDIIIVSAAGNEGDSHYQGTYSDNGSGANSKSIYATLEPGDDVYVALQWNDKFGASSNDYDLAVYRKGTNTKLEESTDTQDGNDDPYEWLDYINESSSTIEVEVRVLNHNAATAKIIELFMWSYDNATTNITAADSIYGHPNTKDVIAVGAISAEDSGWDTPEYWSSQGPTTMLTEMRAKPEIMGIDNVSVTGVGDFGSPFSGTSASAPAVAAVVAQLWGAFPTMKDTQIQSALLASAVDIGASGYDYINGFGRADALRAYQLLASGVTSGSAEKSITVFNLAGVAGTINETSHTIAINLPAGTSVTSIAPTITVSAKATVSPISGAAKNFTSPVTYTVTAENGTTQTYTVTATVAATAKSSAKAITAFTLKGVAGTINETEHTIAVNLPTGTSLTSIAPTIAVSAKATVSPTSLTAKTFTVPVVYTVTAEDGTTQTYTVTATVAATAKSSAKAITAFTLSGISGTINETSRTIAVNLPAGTSLTSIAPTITVSAKATVSPTSGTSRSFTGPVIYTVTAEDGSTQSYVVTVTVSSAAQSSAKAITAFILGGKTGVINETDHSITVSLPSGTNVTALVPDIYLSVKSTVSPGSGAAKNYTNPVNYIVTAENGTIQAYVVTVIVGASTNNTSPIGTITYSIKTPTSGSVIATLVPSETVTVNSTGGFTHTFTQNGTFTFTFTDSDGNTGSAVATVNNIDKTTPIITLNGNSTINLTTGTAYNEQGAIATDNIDGSVGVVTSGSVNANTAGTYIITYVATDAAGNVTTATRTVKVTGTNTTTSANALLTFAFKTLSPDVFGIIDETNHTVLLTVPAGTNLTALVPTIRVSDGATVNPTSETAQNFTTPKTYTVTSSTGAKQTYTITVKKETINLPLGIFDGDIIQCKTSFDPFAVYIVKIVGDKVFIRHIVSLQIFNYYKHLQWANLKQVSSLSPYSLSGWVRVNTGSNGRPGANDKVYEVNGDQSKHWINMTAQQFLTHGGSDEAIYTVNQGELNLYKTGVDVMSL